jgi:hypothetical protein
MSRGPILRFVARSSLYFLAAFSLSADARADSEVCSKPLTKQIPKRVSQAPTGSKVMEQLLEAGETERDNAVVQQVLSGNLPSFLRQLTPVGLGGVLAGGKQVLIIICVTPDYLALGDDHDFVRVPMGLPAAARVANELGFLLPTTTMVDAIYQQAKVQMAPSPMKPTRQMSSTSYLLRHNQTVGRQRARLGRSLTELTAGQKKDIVLSNRLRSKPGRVAIYGWHRPNGVPIQPLSTVHGARYADYSHGVRLVSKTAYINGKRFALADIMRDDELARIVNKEGPIDNVRGLMSSLY